MDNNTIKLFLLLSRVAVRQAWPKLGQQSEQIHFQLPSESEVQIKVQIKMAFWTAVEFHRTSRTSC